MEYPPIVLDTNIWIGALDLKERFPVDREAALQALLHYDPAFSEATYWELDHQLTKVEKIKADTSEKEREDLLKMIQEEGYVYETVETIEGVSRDESDNRFLEVAKASEAELIVSNDKHLLELESYQGILIVSSKEFLAQDLEQRIQAAQELYQAELKKRALEQQQTL